MITRFLLIPTLIILLIFPAGAVHPAETYITAAEIFNEHHGGDEATSALFEKASELSNGRYDLLRNAARSYAAIYHYQKAMDTMKKAIQIGGEHPTAYVFLGIWAMKEYNNATMRDEYLKKAVSCEAQDAVDVYHKAIAQAYLGDLKGGIETISNGTSQFNTTDYLWDWKGLFEAAGGDYGMAALSYDKAINISTDPRNKAGDLIKKATYLVLSGNGTPEVILNMSAEADSLDKGSGWFFEPLIGTAYYSRGDLRNASGHFAPDKSYAYQIHSSIDSLMRADFLYKSGNRQDAVNIYKEARSVDEKEMLSDIWSSMYYRVNLNFAERGLFRDAIDRKSGSSALTYATSLVQRNPDNPLYRQYLKDAENLTASG